MQNLFLTYISEEDFGTKHFLSECIITILVQPRTNMLLWDKVFYCQSFCNTTLFLVYLWIASKFIASTFTLYYSVHIKYKTLCAAKALRDNNGISALNMYMCKIPKCLVIYCIRRAIFLDLKHFILEETYADYISPAFILCGMSLLTLANNFQFF